MCLLLFKLNKSKVSLPKFPVHLGKETKLSTTKQGGNISLIIWPSQLTNG